MKNKEFHKLLKKNKSNTNSGFTLTELLVGLIMSIFVIGALGFGLLQILRFTQKGNSETLVRNDSSRALDFISDEMRRARAIDVDMDVTKFNTVDDPATTDVDESNNMIAPDYSLPTGGEIRLSLQIPGVDQRVIYSVAPPESTSPWKGPLVIYRWGPVLGADGNYTAASLADPTTWKNEALVDGISDQDVTAVGCDLDDDGTDDTYQGFFACVVDDDGDALTEDATDTNADGQITFADDSNDKNGDGEINFGDTLVDGVDTGTDITFADSAWDKNGDGKIDADDAADVDGIAITAQLYFSGETKDADGINTSTYSANTKAVARSRTAPDDNADDFGQYITSFTTLDPSFSCNTDVDWAMRTDFGDSLTNPSNVEKWDHEADRQPQPISTNTDTLVISAVPRGKPGESGKVQDASTVCLNSREGNSNTRSGNGHGDSTNTQDFAGNKTLSDSDDWHTNPNNDIVAISHGINFDDPRTFNGDPDTCSSYPCSTNTKGKVLTQNDGAVATVNPYVLVFKNGSELPALQPFDQNGDGVYEQDSLGKFLADKGLAELVNSGDDPDTGVYKIKDDALGNDERIIAFEVGKGDVSDITQPGVDFQDNIFRLRSDAFAQKYKTYSDNYSDDSNYNPPTYNGTY